MVYLLPLLIYPIFEVKKQDNRNTMGKVEKIKVWRRGVWQGRYKVYVLKIYLDLKFKFRKLRPTVSNCFSWQIFSPVYKFTVVFVVIVTREL